MFPCRSRFQRQLGTLKFMVRHEHDDGEEMFRFHYRPNFGGKQMSPNVKACRLFVLR